MKPATTCARHWLLSRYAYVLCSAHDTEVIMSMPWAVGPLARILEFDPKMVLGPGWVAVTFEHN